MEPNFGSDVDTGDVTHMLTRHGKVYYSYNGAKYLQTSQHTSVTLESKNKSQGNLYFKSYGSSFLSENREGGTLFPLVLWGWLKLSIKTWKICNRKNIADQYL